jgi:hypothetical protein
MVSPWRRKNCGRKITKPKIRLLMVISTHHRARPIPCAMPQVAGYPPLRT